MSLEIGSLLGDYRIVSRVGAGACGEVFEAEHVITRRVEAIKILTEGRPATPEEERRFLREIQVQASLHHPNIAAVHNAFWAPQGVALVMELVKGEPLRAILERGRLPLVQGAGYVLGMLSGLIYAEMQGVVHRDVKPENIMVTPDGSVKLTDFGLAQTLTSPRLTQPGTFAGSPCYMSPEQAMATTEVDRRSDIYSTGVVLYEIITGRPPFQDRNGFAVMLAHQNARPTPPIDLEPGIGPALNRVVLKALQKEPSQRFQNALEFHTALKQALAAATAQPRALKAAARARTRRRLGFAASLLAGVGALAGSAAYFTRVHPEAEALPAPAAASEPAPAVEPPTIAAPVPEPQATAAAAGEPKPAALKIPQRTESKAPPRKLAPLRITSTERAAPVEAPPEIRPAPEAPGHVSLPPQPQGPPPPAPGISPPPAPAAALAGEPAAKPRNPVVRTLGKFFGKFKHRPESQPKESFGTPAAEDPNSTERPAPKP